jgi:trans-aconitate 2-methyltransferase
LTQAAYAFRDTEQAAARLSLLAAMWEPASAPFIAGWAPPAAELAYDLGCGTGWTTRLLAEVAQPRVTVGLDAAENFIEKARRLHPVPEFETWDALRAGFPRGAAGAIYCRMLLTHLPDPAGALELWAGELRAGGTLLVDEVEAIATEDEVFSRYLEIAAGLVAKRNGDLYVGRTLDGLRPRSLETVTSCATLLSPDPRQVAFLFRLNLGVWRDAPDVPASRGELDDISGSLRSRAVGGAQAITWTMRQVAWRRE